MSFLIQVDSQTQGEELRHPEGPSCRKEPIEVVQTSDQDASEHVQLGGNPRADPEHAGGIMYPIWTGEHLGIAQEELEDVAEETDVWATLLSLLPDQTQIRGERRWTDGWRMQNFSDCSSVHNCFHTEDY